MHSEVPKPFIYSNIVSLPVLSVLTMKSLPTNPKK
jgi:hypothetical protein